MRTPTRIEMEDFKHLLNQEITLHDGIEQCLKQKQEVIIQGDLATLATLDSTLENMTQQIRALEQERLALMVRMGREGETLREFIANLEHGEDAHVLDQARTQLIQVTNDIKSLSRSNRDLLTQSIRFIEQSVDFIASILAPEGASYTKTPTRRHPAGESGIESLSITPSTVSYEA